MLLGISGHAGKLAKHTLRNPQPASRTTVLTTWLEGSSKTSATGYLYCGNVIRMLGEPYEPSVEG